MDTLKYKKKELEGIIEPYIALLESPFLYNFEILEKIYMFMSVRFSNKEIEVDDIKKIELDNKIELKSYVNVIFDFITLLDKKASIDEISYLAYFKEFIEEKIVTYRANKIQMNSLLSIQQNALQLNEKIEEMSKEWIKENESFLRSEAFLAFCNTPKIKDGVHSLEEKEEKSKRYIEVYLETALARKKIEYKKAFEKRSDISIEKCSLINNNENLLFVSSQNEHNLMLELILNKANINVKNDKGETLLHLAARKGDMFTEFLLDKGALLDEKDSQKFTPIYLAVENGHFPVVNLLIDKGAKISEEDAKGRTPLHVAVREGHIKITKLLLSKGAGIKKEKGWTILHLAVRNEKTDMIDFLLNQGMKIDDENNRRCPVLHLASEEGSSFMVEFLLSRGADIEGKDENGMTALHFAVARGSFPIVKLLVDKGANPNVKEKDKMTPLHFAALKSSAITELLLNKNAEVNVENNDGKTALNLAIKMKNEATKKTGIENKADEYNTVIELLLNKSMETNGKEQKSLHLAVWEGDIKRVNFLLNRKVNVEKRNEKGATALHFAAFKKNIPMVRLLLDRGANPLSIDNDGVSPILIAAIINEAEEVRKILFEGIKNIGYSERIINQRSNSHKGRS